MEQVLLPDKLSDCIELALRDLAECEALPKVYRIHMGTWHQPYGDICIVCLGGAVIARTLKTPSFAEVSPHETGEHNRKRLNALDIVRTGDIATALNALGTTVPRGIPGYLKVSSYALDKEGFKLHLLAIARMLRARGK